MTNYARHSHRRSSKYYQVYVPTYDGSSMSAYVRLGKVPRAGEPSTASGSAMADKFTQFAANNHTDHTRAGPAASSKGDFVAGLGWRDHTDGNRLSTTGGDKVEVIGGSYQMIICHGGDVVVDASGGVLWDSDQLPSLVTEVHRDGSKIIEKVWHGAEYYGTSHGARWERHTGPSHVSILGDPGWEGASFVAAPAGTAPEGGNPDVFDGVWAGTYTDIEHATTIIDKSKADTNFTMWVEAGERLEDTTTAATLVEHTNVTSAYTSIVSSDGSGGKVPQVSDETHAMVLQETVKANSITETVMADSITETTTVTGTYASAISASVHTDDITATTRYASLIMAPTIQEYFFTTNHLSIYAGSREAFSFSGALEIITPFHREIHLGWFGEITLGKKTDLVIGAENEKVIGWRDFKGLGWKAQAMAIFLG